MSAASGTGPGELPILGPAPGPHWTDGTFLAFDVETTGVDVDQDRIVTASLVRISRGHEPVTVRYVIDPRIEVPESASAIHGWTNDKIDSYPDVLQPPEALDAIHEALFDAWHDGRPVIAYNAPFDLSIFSAECSRNGLVPIPPDMMRPVVDPMVIDKHIDPYRRGRRTLAAVCEHYGIRLDAAHDSNADALAAARLAYKLCRRPELAHMDLYDLHTSQAVWKVEQADSFSAYLARQGKPCDDVSGAWPCKHAPHPYDTATDADAGAAPDRTPAA